MNPLVSVIVPFHNAKAYVEHTVSSLLLLDSERFEIVVIDDHSTDGTFEELVRWVSGQPHARIVRSNSKGVAAARNAGAAAALGAYVWFIDCDDSWDLTVVEHMANVAERSKGDIIMANALISSPSGVLLDRVCDAPSVDEITGQEALGRLFRGEVQGHLWNKLFKTTLLADDPFPATRAHSDLGGTIGIFARSDRVVLIPRVVYRYVLRPGSMSNNTSQYRWDDLSDCLDLARDAVFSLGNSGGMSRDLRVFSFTKVIVPLEHEAVRREGWEAESTIRAVRHANRSRVSLIDLVRLVLGGHLHVAIQGLAIKWWPKAYRAVYRRHRRLAWSELDSHHLYEPSTVPTPNLE